jgi:hypothetical protein
MQKKKKSGRNSVGRKEKREGGKVGGHRDLMCFIFWGVNPLGDDPTMGTMCLRASPSPSVALGVFPRRSYEAQGSHRT